MSIQQVCGRKKNLSWKTLIANIITIEKYSTNCSTFSHSMNTELHIIEYK